MRGASLAKMIESMYAQAEAPQQVPTDEWYTAHIDAIEPSLRLSFYPSNVDEETYEFLNTSSKISQSLCLQVSSFQQVIVPFLTFSGLLYIFNRFS